MSKPDPERLAAWRGVNTAQARVSAALDSALRAERDLTLSWFELLEALVVSGPKTVGQLARAIAGNGATISRRLDRMQAEDLVERVQDRGDARVIKVSVTAAGRAIYRGAVPTWRRCLQREFAAVLTDTDVVALSRIAAKLNPIVD